MLERLKQMQVPTEQDARSRAIDYADRESVSTVVYFDANKRTYHVVPLSEFKLDDGIHLLELIRK